MIIEIKGLSKQYGETRALSGINLEIESGGVVGLLGPNGAGKTTLVEILEGLRSPSAGTVRVLGFDPARQARLLREHIGVQLQSTAMPEELTPTETLRLFASFFSKALDSIEVLARFGLADKAKCRNSTLSGGERQRLAIAMALINDPVLVLLDEPTSGLDPGARRETYRYIRELRDANRTVLFTTHYLEEAEELCDRVIILRGGETVADGRPEDLVAGAAEAKLCIALRGTFDSAPLLQAGAQSQGRDDGAFRFVAPVSSRVILVLAELLRDPCVMLVDMRTERPSLENAYHKLVAQSASELRPTA